MLLYEEPMLFFAFQKLVHGHWMESQDHFYQATGKTSKYLLLWSPWLEKSQRTADSNKRSFPFPIWPHHLLLAGSRQTQLFPHSVFQVYLAVASPSLCSLLSLLSFPCTDLALPSGCLVHRADNRWRYGMSHMLLQCHTLLEHCHAATGNFVLITTYV